MLRCEHSQKKTRAGNKAHAFLRKVQLALTSFSSGRESTRLAYFVNPTISNCLEERYCEQEANGNVP
jgi:hypothetical protein